MIMCFQRLPPYIIIRVKFEKISSVTFDRTNEEHYSFSLHNYELLKVQYTFSPKTMYISYKDVETFPSRRVIIHHPMQLPSPKKFKIGVISLIIYPVKIFHPSNNRAIELSFSQFLSTYKSYTQNFVCAICNVDCNKHK